MYVYIIIAFALLELIDELYENAEEEEDVARGFAEHEAQEREYALLELQRARDPVWEWMPGGVGNLGW